MSYNHIQYCRKITQTFSEFQGINDCFARVSSIAGLEEFLSNQSSAPELSLLAVDMHDGVMGDGNRTDLFLDQPYHRFYLVQKLDLNDFDSREQALKELKALGTKIIFKFLKDKKAKRNGLQFLDMGRIPYITVGPLGDGYHGLEFSFSVVDKLWQEIPELTEGENFTL